MTLDEWAAMEEDDPGELVDGQLVEEEDADLVHELVGSCLIRVLYNWLYARAASATEGRLDKVPGCPGLSIDVDEIWSEVAELEAPLESEPYFCPFPR